MVCPPSHFQYHDRCLRFSIFFVEECKAVISLPTVAPEVEWNQREGKERFGQPIRTPELAEDVKGRVS